MIRKFAAIALTILLADFAHAYPIFFSCRADKSISMVLTPQELATRLNQLNQAPGSVASKVERACRDLEECLRDFNRLVQIARATAAMGQTEIARQVSERADRRMQEMQGMIRVSGPNGAQLRRLYNLQTQIYECTASRASVAPDSVRSTDQQSCAVGNFRHTPYMYVGGARFSGEPDGEQRQTNYQPMTCESINEVIRGAVAMGQDPFAALGIASMEEGTDIAGLYLDPIGAVGAIGCPATQTSATGNHNFESFSTFYRVNLQTVQNPQLADKIQNFVRLNNGDIEAGNSYICVSSGNGAGVYDQPTPDSCCLSLGFRTPNTNLPERALVYSSLRGYLRNSLRPELQTRNPAEAAARRLQNFNGWSRLMGGAEGVPAWRSGINFYNTPTYGYQAMDFVMNSMLANPYIIQEVARAQQELGVRSPSILCEDLTAGTYMMDHNYYSSRVASAPRMGTVEERWRAGVRSLSGLTQAQRNVMKGELEQMTSPRNVRILTEHFRRNPVPGVTTDESFFQNFSGESDQNFQFYMQHILPLRRTVSQASQMDQGYTWRDMTDPQFNAYREAILTPNPGEWKTAPMGYGNSQNPYGNSSGPMGMGMMGGGYPAPPNCPPGYVYSLNLNNNGPGCVQVTQPTPAPAN